PPPAGPRTGTPGRRTPPRLRGVQSIPAVAEGPESGPGSFHGSRGRRRRSARRRIVYPGPRSMLDLARAVEARLHLLHGCVPREAARHVLQRLDRAVEDPLFRRHDLEDAPHLDPELLTGFLRDRRLVVAGDLHPLSDCHAVSSRIPMYLMTPIEVCTSTWR